jgi:putative flippase GtrA
VSTVPGVGLTPSSGGPPSRRSRERRAYQLVVVGGTAGLIAVVGFVLAAVGVMGFGIPFLAAIVAVVCALIFRRTVAR